MKLVPFLKFPLFGADVVIFKKTIIFIWGNALAFGGEITCIKRNKLVFGANMLFSARTVVFETNTAFFQCKLIGIFGIWDKTVESWANTLVFWSNTTVFGSNTGVF